MKSKIELLCDYIINPVCVSGIQEFTTKNFKSTDPAKNAVQTVEEIVEQYRALIECEPDWSESRKKAALRLQIRARLIEI
jgi:hypothetical protein